MEMEEQHRVTTISGTDVIMAYGDTTRTYVAHSSDSHLCTCLFWSRYTMFVINFLVVATGVTFIGIGTWAQINGVGMNIFDTILHEPTWMLIGTGVVMILVGAFGCAGSLRLNVVYLRVFMLLVVLVFLLQVTVGAVAFFLLHDVHERMLSIMRSAIMSYSEGSELSSDKAVDYIQKEFQCCGASSISDWEVNKYFNCSSVQSVSRCGVPRSCCRGVQDLQCGHGIRDGTVEYTDMFAFSQGCVVRLSEMIQDNVIAITALAFTVGFLEMCSLFLANVVIKKTIYHEKLLS